MRACYSSILPHLGREDAAKRHKYQYQSRIFGIYYKEDKEVLLQRALFSVENYMIHE